MKSRSGFFSRGDSFTQIIPHSDGAGEIDRVGPGVDRARIGERVWVYNAQWRRPFGTAAQYVTLPSAQAVRLPEGVSFAEGACLGIPALTAWRAVTIEQVAGKQVLIAGGAGAVGNAALQIAKAHGARVLTTVSSEEKARLVSEDGADEVINYRSPDAAERILAATGGRGADAVIEVDLAANVQLDAKVTAAHGSIVVYGTSAPMPTLPAIVFLMRSLSLRFVMVYEMHPAVFSAAIAGVNELLTQRKLRSRIAARLPLDRIAEAHELVESGKAIGNVVLEIP